MKLFQRIISNLGFFILVMLLFLLFFQNKVSLPPALQAVGRMHPLLLHLPIGLLVIAFILWLSRKSIEPNSFRNIFILVLQVTAFTAALTALMGFFLSREGGYDDDILFKHKLLGVATAVIFFLLLWIYQFIPRRRFVFGLSMILSLFVMLVGSHFGANLTHGEGFVLQPLQNIEDARDEPVTDSSTLFAAAIRPILKSKCFSCHNERKAKGGLVLTSEEKILLGGKNGPVWIPGDALNSHIIQNINLPEDDKRHMPPKGKTQLSTEETDLLYTWIQRGADMKRMLIEYTQDDTLKMLASPFIPRFERQVETVYSFAAAPLPIVQKLNTAFCAVFPVSQNSPALQADFFVREKFDRKKLEDLLKVKEQLIVLNLGNMPVDDADMKTIGEFINLEKLILNFSQITNNGLNEIRKLKKLSSLSVAGTAIDKNALASLLAFESLREIFIWNTRIAVEEAAQFQRSNNRIILNTGYQPDPEEVLTLTPPSVKNDEFVLKENEKIELKNAIPGTTIRYTIDGTDPDSINSPVYNGPIRANGFTIVKARSVKAGWYSSPVVSFSFFEKGIKPAKAELINEPDPKYRGEGAKTLIDGKSGLAENFNDPAWLGYREKPFAAWFYFDSAKAISQISISYSKNIQSYLLPPAEIEIWAGEEKDKLKLLKKLAPPQPGKTELNTVRMEGVNMSIGTSFYKVYKIVAKNVSRLPSWHPGKGDKAWIFIDEIFFN